VIQALAAGAAREVGADAQLWLNTAFGGDYSLRSQAPFAVLLEQWLTSAPDGGMIMCHPGVTTATQRQELGVLESDRLSTLLQTLSVQLEPPSDRFSSPSTSNRAKDRRSDGR
jgi:hypothetical protein